MLMRIAADYTSLSIAVTYSLDIDIRRIMVLIQLDFW
jgi:hypothetical protein